MWLLESAVKQALEQAQIAGVLPNVEQQAQYEATRISALSDSSSQILTVAGNTAEISINGILTNTPSFLAMLFGGGNTTYTEIISAIAETENDPNITETIFNIDSVGGNIDGLFNTLDAIHNMKKPTIARISNIAASAAYAIASQSDNIVAVNNAARFGSIGILVSFRVDENKIDITSTNAPKKAPDVTTAKGKAIVREELDAIHNIFVDAVARGRDVSIDEINAKFGQGAVLLAGEALKRGMIDSIGKPALTVVDSAKIKTAANGGEHTKKVKIMDLNELKAKYPDVYSAAVSVGIEQGINQERDRVTAHLHMGKESGATDVAIEAIEKGDGLTATINAKYLTAGMARSDIDNRENDDTDTANGLAGTGTGGAGADGKTTAEAENEAVVVEVERQLGINAVA